MIIRNFREVFVDKPKGKHYQLESLERDKDAKKFIIVIQANYQRKLPSKLISSLRVNGKTWNTPVLQR